MNKNYIYLVLLLSLTSCGITSYSFIDKINPSRKYTISTNTTSSYEYKHITESVELKDKIIKNSDSYSYSRVITTEKVNNKGQIPATMEYGNAIFFKNGKEIENTTTGTVVNGFYFNNSFSVDSIKSNIDSNTERNFKYALENIEPEIIFPKKALKIGDSIEYINSMNIPVLEYAFIKIDVVKTLTLNTVNNGIAVFDLKENAKLNTVVTQENAIVQGSGKGIIEFDIAKNQIIKNNTELIIELELDVTENLNVESLIKYKSDIKTVIE